MGMGNWRVNNSGIRYTTSMSRDDILTILHDHAAELAREFGVSKIGIFGSAARDEMGPESDVDVLVDFYPDRVPGLFKFVALERHLAELLGREVDLATLEALKPAIKPGVMEDLRYA